MCKTDNQKNEACIAQDSEMWIVEYILGPIAYWEKKKKKTQARKVFLSFKVSGKYVEILQGARWKMHPLACLKLKLMFYK